MQAFQHRVAVFPGRLSTRCLDLVPVQVEADEIDAEQLEPVQPLFEIPGPVDEPGVVLDAEAHTAGGARRGGDGADEGARKDGYDKEAHEGSGSPTPTFRHIRILLTTLDAAAPRRLPPFDGGCEPDGREPHVDEERERRAEGLQD